MATQIWQCPKCKMIAEIKGNTKTIKSSLRPEKALQGFPSHADCELSRPIARMNFSRLIKVREE